MLFKQNLQLWPKIGLISTYFIRSYEIRQNLHNLSPPEVQNSSKTVKKRPKPPFLARKHIILLKNVCYLHRICNCDQKYGWFRRILLGYMALCKNLHNLSTPEVQNSSKMTKSGNFLQKNNTFLLKNVCFFKKIYNWPNISLDIDVFYWVTWNYTKSA